MRARLDVEGWFKNQRYGVDFHRILSSASIMVGGSLKLISISCEVGPWLKGSLRSMGKVLNIKRIFSCGAVKRLRLEDKGSGVADAVSP